MELEEEEGVLPRSLLELGNQSPLHLDAGSGISFSPLTDADRVTISSSPHPEALMGLKRQTCCCSSPRDPGNKENHHTESENTLVMPLVTEEPQQTRKRKKGRGCKLRNSLAWNNAFFTEEGVLNSSELSMLSGSVGESGKSFLSRVDEGETSLVAGSCKRSDRSVLQAFEDNLFKGMPAKFQNEDQKLNGFLLKLESSTQEDLPTSASSRKALLTKGNSRSALQGGGSPRPITSYSQKKIIDTSTTNGMSKIPKPLATKAESSLLPVIPKSVIQPTKRPKYNQNSPPVIPVKNTSLKGPSAGKRKGITCTVSSAKSSKPCPAKHKANLPSETHLSVSLQTTHSGMAVGTANLKVIPEQTHEIDRRASTSTAVGTANLKVIPEQTHEIDRRASTSNINSNEVTARLSQHVPLVNSNIPSAQYHTKPSGLRMPSPSLGFFSRGKVSASNKFISEKNKQQCNLSEINISTARKLCELSDIDELKPLYTPYARSPKMFIDAPVIGATGAAASGSQVCSTVKCPIPSIENAKSNSELKTPWKRGLEDSSDARSQEIRHSNHSVIRDRFREQIGKQAIPMVDPQEVKQVSNKENHTETASFQQPQKDSIFEVSHDSNASGDTSGIELVNPHSFSRVSFGKQPTHSVPRANSEVEHPHLDAPMFKEPPLFSESQRHSNDHWPVEKYDSVPEIRSGVTKCNADQSCEEVQPSLGLREEQVVGVGTARSLESVPSLTKNIVSSHQVVSQSYGSITLGSDNGLTNGLQPGKTLTELSGDGKHSDSLLQSQSKDSLSTKDKAADIQSKKKHVGDDSRQDHNSMKFQVNAVPFSDEWVAALEAIGEDILTMKSGAVQNSPPDKNIPEPGPYSPVKRSTQDIGPFDCTKHTSVATSDTQ